MFEVAFAKIFNLGIKSRRSGCRVLPVTRNLAPALPGGHAPSRFTSVPIDIVGIRENSATCAPIRKSCAVLPGPAVALLTMVLQANAAFAQPWVSANSSISPSPRLLTMRP